MLRHTSRKQVPSWLCCWSAYHHSSLYSASLCRGGHLHPMWPESARGCKEVARFGWSAFAWSGISAGFSRNPVFFFRNIFKWSFSVCERKKKLMLEVEETVPPLNPSTKMPNPVFRHLVILIFPWLFCDIPFTSCLCHCSTDVYPCKNKAKQTKTTKKTNKNTHFKNIYTVDSSKVFSCIQ